MRKQFTILLTLVFVFALTPINFLRAEDLGGKLKGRILLQVESKGEAWYVNPDNSKRYYLGRPDDAFKVMRELGLGISNKDFDSFNGVAPKRLLGKILIKVEDSGKAYYVNPANLKMHFLGKPADAFKVMRESGMGIKNDDLNKIEIYSSDKLSPEIKNQKFTISDLLEAVVQINCYTGFSSSEGSGFLYKIKNKNYVVTNYHVVNDPNIKGCTIFVNNKDDAEVLGLYNLDINNIKVFNNDTDSAFLEVTNKTSTLISSKEIQNLNYNINEVQLCSNSKSVGSKVYIIGYPAYAESTVEINGESSTIQARTLTEGIISGYDNSKKYPYGNSPYANYFVTAIIDGGNSGGLALSEEKGSYCLLGTPTWVSIGNYVNQGIVQNINNMLYQSK